jgi:hypothetical protein
LIVRLIMASAFSFFAVLLCLCGCFNGNGYRKSLARAAAVAADERSGELQLHATGAAATNMAARLPAFKYSRAVKHNVTGGEEAAATCSVCLGAFQLGEKVRLLPACLHLYHAECIDLWLDVHSTRRARSAARTPTRRWASAGYRRFKKAGNVRGCRFLRVPRCG